MSGVLAARTARCISATADSMIGRVPTLLVVGLGAIGGAAMGVRFGTSVELAAYLLLVAAALPLSTIDIAVRKVPDRILLPAVPAAIALLALAAHSAGAYGALGRALLAGVAAFAAYLLLALGSGQLGLGDCKAAGLCGLYLGYLGWRAVALGAVSAFVLAAVSVVVRVAIQRAARDRSLAFAPYIFAGAILAIVIS
jgi:leader peptidase (prepilin peptidase)/N-methyltransferase